MVFFHSYVSLPEGSQRFEASPEISEIVLSRTTLLAMGRQESFVPWNLALVDFHRALHIARTSAREGLI